MFKFNLCSSVFFFLKSKKELAGCSGEKVLAVSRKALDLINCAADMT